MASTRPKKTSRRTEIARKPIHRVRQGVVARNIAKALLVSYSLLVICPIRYHPANVGLDPSWAVALNYFHLHGTVFGRDTGFTYGPLGYLILPMAMGSNLLQGLLFQAGVWVLFSAIVIWRVVFRKIPLHRLAIFAICAIFGADIFVEFGYAGPDFFLAVLVLLLLGTSAAERNWQPWYILAAGLTVLLAFIKFSTAIGAVTSLVLAPIGFLFFDRSRAWRMALLVTFITPLFFVSGYLVYQPSVDSLIHYVHAAADISSSYSNAMSLAGGPRELTEGVLLLVAYAMVTLVLFWTKQRSAVLALAAAGQLFLEFKHSFVRQPGHAEIVFTFLPLIVGILILFTDLTRRPAWVAATALVLLAGVWYSRESGRASAAHLAYNRYGTRNASNAAKALNYHSLRADLEDASRANLTADRLPPELLTHVAEKPIGVFPWEASYAAANPINYRPFPIFQTYSASTPFLDTWNAGFLNDIQRSPEFLLFEWNSIDGRHPFLDVPAMSIAMLQHYQLDSAWGARLLLRRRAQPLEGATRLVRSEILKFGAPLRFPASSHPSFARIYLRFNIVGALRNFFFRVPEVDVLLSSQSARFALARVPPEVMQDGIPLNFLPSDMEGARQLFQNGQVVDAFSELVLLGPGAGNFVDSFRAEIYEMPGIDLAVKTVAATDLSKLRYLGTLDTARLESLNNRSAVEIPASEVMELGGKTAMVLVQGWAFDNFVRQPAAAVLIELDGKLYRSNYGSERMDIVALFGSRELARTGFQWGIPAWKLGRSTHEISLKIVSSDGRGYYDAGKRNRFRITE